MSPPPYSRTSTQPFQRHLVDLQQENMAQDMSSYCLIPESAEFNNTFEVCIKRNSLGLGFSICGGVEAPAPWTNLIRIKKIFPLQPAWETGQLKIGDVLLKVSGVPLTGLSLRQALDILRTSPPLTKLLVCRIPDPVSTSSQTYSPTNSKQHRSSVVRSYSYGPYNINTWQNFRTDQDLKSFANLSLNTVEAAVNSQGLNSAGESMEIDISPSTPEKEWSPPSEGSNPLLYPSSSSRGGGEDNRGGGELSNTMDLLKPIEDTLRCQAKIIGEFSVTLTKVKGSLGFSLLSTDDTVLNHSIKAILRDPALSDGRIQAGDKLVSANGVDLSTYSHQELIAFLRQCDETVKLGLFRDASRSGTPLDVESPPLPKSRDGSLTRKHLRYEAKELVRSLQSSRTSLEKAGLGSQPGSYSASAAAGTLGRRRVRQFSPATQSRHNYYGAGGMSSAGGGSGLLTAAANGAGGAPPTVESPATPHNSSAPPSLGLGMSASAGNVVGMAAAAAVTPVSRREFNNLAVVADNNNCDEKLCIEEIDSGTDLTGGDSDYMVSTPGGGYTPAGGGYAVSTPGGGVEPHRLFISPSAALDNSRDNLMFRNGRDDDANRNSVPRILVSSGASPEYRKSPPSSPTYAGGGNGGAEPSFLTCEQSRSLPRGIPLFSTEPDSDKNESLTRPTQLNLNKDAKKRRGFYFSPARF